MKCSEPLPKVVRKYFAEWKTVSGSKLGKKGKLEKRRKEKKSLFIKFKLCALVSHIDRTNKLQTFPTKVNTF